METILCKYCGKKLDHSMKTCPDCGAINPHNSEIIANASRQFAAEVKATKHYSNVFFTAALIFGIILFLLQIILIVSVLPMYLVGFAFVGAVSGGFDVFFSILGIVKKESTGKAVFIAGGISLWMLVMNAFLLI